MRHFMLTLTHTIVQGYNIGLVGSTENTNMILEAFYKVWNLKIAYSYHENNRVENLLVPLIKKYRNTASKDWGSWK